MKKLLFAVLTLISVSTTAQKEEKKITVKTYGFVGFDAIMDSRQSASVRQNHVYLYPLAKDLDVNGKDLNDRSKSDFTMGNTRLGFAITGPDAFGAATSAKIEGDFLGTSGNDKDYAVRIRHAFFNLKWDKSALLLGQTWHPFFVAENFPGTVNFVVGAPIHPISRAPQIKYTYYPSSDFSLSVIALSQGDFKNTGALEQVEYAGMPEMNVQLKYGSPKSFFMAATAGFKNVQPILTSEVQGATQDEVNKYYVDNTVSSFQVNVSARYTTSPVTFKAEYIYGGNMTNFVMIGGLAEKTTSTAENPEFVPIKTNAYWAEAHTNGKKVQFGIFAGKTNNQGTSDNSVINDTGYTRGANIASVTAYAPRVVFKSGKMTVGLELLHTIAAYGSGRDEKSKPIHTTNYSNNRITLGCRYNF